MAASTSTINIDNKFNIVTEISEDADFSVNLRLPKFSNNCTDVDFLSALENKINKEEIKYLGKLRYSNEWQITLKTKSTRDQLLEIGNFLVKGKKCVVYPCGRQAVGRIHWLPIDVPEEAIKDILRHFGDVSKFGCEKLFPSTNSPHSLIRFFIVNLSKDCSSEDLPHFISVNKHQGLVVVKGRDPMCLECRQIGHRKKVCPVIEQRRIERAAKNSKKGDKKSKTGEPVVKTEPGESSNSTSKNKEKTTAKNNAAAACSTEGPGNTRVQESINTVATDVKRLQHLMNVFSQRMNEVLASGSLNSTSTDAIQSAIEHSESLIAASVVETSNKQAKKKKKKKAKTSDNYDLVAAQVVSNDTSNSSQHSSKASLDSGIVSNENSTSNSSDNNNTDSNGNTCSKNVLHTNVNTNANLDVNIQSKKKRNKKKKSSGTMIPGLTHP